VAFALLASLALVRTFSPHLFSRVDKRPGQQAGARFASWRREGSIQSMIPKSGYRFSDQIMLNQELTNREGTNV
jgi:hypothetical protein